MLLCAISLWIFDYETQVIDEGSKCIIEYVLHIALMRDSWIIHSFYFFPIKSVSRKNPKKLEESENVHSTGKSKRMETQLSALWNV